MKRMTTFCAAAIASLGMTGSALAMQDYRYSDRYDTRYDEYGYDDRHDRGYQDRYRHQDQRHDWGEVIRVDPIVAANFQPIHRNECWSQPVVYREPARYHYRDRGDRAPAIVGAIVGGVIGNQFGSGSGRDAATLAGAALGYSAVRDSTRHGGYYTSGGRSYQVMEQRCAPRTSYVRDERVRGYEVTYRYRGEIYRTTTDYHPGDRIQVRIDVTPLP